MMSLGAMAKLGPAFPNGSGSVNETYMRRLDCANDRQWSSFQRLLIGRFRLGRIAEDEQLQAAAEALLGPLDHQTRSFFQQGSSSFLAKLLGLHGSFCFPGYVAACWVRLVRLASQEDPQLEADAQHCSSIFGKEGSLDLLSSTSWPIQLLDVEIFMRRCPDSAFGSLRGERHAYTFRDLREHWRTRRSASRLRVRHSVDPEGLNRRVQRPLRSLRITSVFGGHCSLWLEPLYTLQVLFPEVVNPLLATYDEDRCSDRFAVDLPVAHLKRSGQDAALTQADVLICMWVSECTRLRVHYSKPVIFYSGFLLLTDQAFQPGHAWWEPLPFFWDRVKQLYACDAAETPADGGPPCAVVFEERQLAAAAHWQTGEQRPFVRPLSLYVQCRHDPLNARPEVLVVNRGRLVLDGLFTEALNAMRHASYPYGFTDQLEGMAFQSMASFHMAVLLPWDLNLVMFHDLYAMALPLLLPDKAGLHHRAFVYLSRFQKSNLGPFKESLHQGGYEFSPFDFEYLEAREYWLDFTEYLTAPEVQHFSSLPDLLLQAVQLDTSRIHRQMRAYNAQCFQRSHSFWSKVLGILGAFPQETWLGCGSAHPLDSESVVESPLDVSWTAEPPSKLQPWLILGGALDGSFVSYVGKGNHTTNTAAFGRLSLPERLELEMVTGAFHWKVVHLMSCTQRQHIRCILLLLDPRWEFIGGHLFSMLGPEKGLSQAGLRLAVWRMRRCLVLLPLPGITKTRLPRPRGVPRRVQRLLTRAAVRQHWRQLARLKRSGSRVRWPLEDGSIASPGWPGTERMHDLWGEEWRFGTFKDPNAIREVKFSGERRRCKHCLIYKPDRCHHCRICHCCILKMDHHCPWIMNCVGFRNHKYFFLLVIYSILSCGFIALTITETIVQSLEQELPLSHRFLLMQCFTTASIMGALLTIFAGFHVMLMLRGLTTIEFCEKMSIVANNSKSSKYDLGLYRNVTAVVGPRPWLWLLPLDPPVGDGLQFDLTALASES
ncbi:unnamed protein product [Effrenium voratum]|uniref:Palmitoyltransferase DHHC domain-containing protein n=1 Tax=Effrenium voratum TaxID=2562239 RepID=A0AA36J170_9DINO|nr:unnamed protein product [Effrenium voratum]